MSLDEIDGNKVTKTSNEDVSPIVVVSLDKNQFNFRHNLLKLHQDGNGQIRLPSYKMDQENHGLVLIINNEKFVDLRQREGSQEDVKKLSGLFKELGFKIIVAENLNFRTMRQALNEFADDDRHKEAEMCVVIILSHGGNGYIECSDGLNVSLFSKVKLFLVSGML